MLKSQLNPHFLFNSLNSVRALIADDRARRKAVTQLARTLRYTLTAGQEEVVSLERELEIVADYLELESCGSASACTSSARSRSSSRRAHSRDDAADRGRECDQARHRRAAAGRRVADQRRSARGRADHRSRESAPSEPSRSPSHGVGLRNAAERLRLLFGTAGGLDLDLSRPDRALARIRIPQGHAE